MIYQVIIINLYYHFYIIDEDKIYNNPNLHSEEQDELENPDSEIYFF
jgi:hypothetical protein